MAIFRGVQHDAAPATPRTPRSGRCRALGGLRGQVYGLNLLAATTHAPHLVEPRRGLRHDPFALLSQVA